MFLSFFMSILEEVKSVKKASSCTSPNILQAIMTISKVKKADEGSYRCAISNAGGEILSGSAKLTVCKFCVGQ